ncbi:hypothetical protein DFJ74DRAFT_687361 [Hyaloraphidium curvatum]|nr:hypothetical protein DFJ74DRAFT_687361 [Hyaloraphidium curvatum]
MRLRRPATCGGAAHTGHRRTRSCRTGREPTWPATAALFLAVLVLLLRTTSAQTDLTACSTACVRASAEEAQCPLTGTQLFPPRSCACDTEAVFYTTLLACLDTDNCRDGDFVREYVQGYCPGLAIPTLNSGGTTTSGTRGSTKTTTTTRTTSAPTTKSGTTTTTKTVTSPTTGTTLSTTRTTSRTSSATTSTVTTTSRTTTLTTVATTLPSTTTRGTTTTVGTSVSTVPPTPTLTGQPLFLAAANGQLACGTTSCSVAVAGDSFQRVCPDRTSNCLAVLLVKAAPGQLCLTVGPDEITVFLSSCRSPIPSISRRQTVSDQLWVFSASGNATQTHVALQANLNCLQPGSGNRVVLDNCVSPAATWNIISSVPPPQPLSSGGLSTGAIIGIVVGSVAGLFLLGGLIAYLVIRDKKKKQAAELALQQRTDDRDAQLAAQNEARAAGFAAGQSPNGYTNGSVNGYSSIPYGSAAPAYTSAVPDYMASIPMNAVSQSRGVSPASQPMQSSPLPGGMASIASAGAAAAAYPSPGHLPGTPSPASPVPPSAAGSIVAGALPAGSADLSLYQGQQCTATRPYNPKYADEMELRPGDVVLVERVHEDGWAQGYNYTSNVRAMLPLNFVRPTGAAQTPGAVPSPGQQRT